MRAAAAVLLHILAVHYLIVLFIIGIPALITGLKLSKRPLFKKYYLSWLFYLVFIVCLAGSKLFPAINYWFLQNYGREGEAVIVHASQQAGWFQRTPELRLVLKIAPDEGVPFIETITTDPPRAIVDELTVGHKVNILYSPDYTHDIAIASW